MRGINKFVICGLIIVLVGVGLLFLLNRKQDRAETQAEVSQVTNDPQKRPKFSDTHVSASESERQKPTNPTTSESVQRNLDSLSNSVQNWSSQVHGKIEFFGKVVDENNQPVKDANIRLIWTQFFPLAEDTPSTNLTSNEDGLFSIAGVIGKSLSVSVSKPGYYNVKSMNQQSFSYSTLPGASPFIPDKSNPVVFHLRKKGLGSALVSGSINAKAPRDGTPLSVDFFRGISGAEGQMQVSQTKPSYETWKKASEWALELSIPDGGFIEQNEEFPFAAPASGYQSTLTFKFQKGQETWATDLNRSYFIKFGSPPRYGRLSVITDISSSGVRLTYAVNPDGSRNLEAE